MNCWKMKKFKDIPYLQGCIVGILIFAFVMFLNIAFCEKPKTEEFETTEEITTVEIPTEIKQAELKIVEQTTEIPTEPTTQKAKKTITMVVTAYCPCRKCCGKTDGITASGVKAKQGVTVAADTRLFPFGTKLEIDGKIYIVQDRGGAIKGNYIDLFFNTHQQALNFGRQTKEVTIL